LRLLRQAFQFARKTRKSLIEREELVSVFFEKLSPRLKSEASFAGRQQREEKLRAFPQASQGSRKRGGEHPVMLQGRFDVPRQILHAQVAYGNSEVVPRHIFEFVCLIENHCRRVGQNPSIRRALRLQLDREIGEEEMMVDDDNVALHASTAHFSDEAALPLAALLSSARVCA